MKNAVIVIVALIIAGSAAYTIVRSKEQKNQELEILARKAEAAQKKAEADRKKAEAEAKKAKDDAAAAKAKETAAKDEHQAKLAAEAEAKELAKAKAEEARAAEAVAKAAAENARKAEDERKTAEAKKAEAEALAEHAAATNAAKQAELQTALAAAHLVELDLQKILATSNVLALQKADYASKLVEVEQLQEELRRREEETRPNKTLQQLIAQNEAVREAELAEMAKRDAQYAEEEAVRRRILREGVPAAPKKELSQTDKRLAAARGAIDEVDAKGREALAKRLTARMEVLIRQAAKDGRMDEAEAYLEALKSLVPSYGKSKVEN